MVLHCRVLAVVASRHGMILHRSRIGTFLVVLHRQGPALQKPGCCPALSGSAAAAQRLRLGSARPGPGSATGSLPRRLVLFLVFWPWASRWLGASGAGRARAVAPLPRHGLCRSCAPYRVAPCPASHFLLGRLPRLPGLPLGFRLRSRPRRVLGLLSTFHAAAAWVASPSSLVVTAPCSASAESLPSLRLLLAVTQALRAPTLVSFAVASLALVANTAWRHGRHPAAPPRCPGLPRCPRCRMLRAQFALS